MFGPLTGEATGPYKSLAQAFLLIIWPRPHCPHRVSLTGSAQGSSMPPNCQVPILTLG